MKAGKHVYCEKPLTHNIWEARQVAPGGEGDGCATQMGNQGHSGEGIRQTCEWIWDGAIGAVREVHAWANAGDLAHGHGRPKETPPVPAGLDWDLWLGPREPRPYHPAYAPYNWRGWWDFGTGGIGDIACHNIDPAVRALQARHAADDRGDRPGIDAEVCPTGRSSRPTTSPAREHAPGERLTGTTAACVRRRRPASTRTTRSSAWARAPTASSSSARRGSSPAAAGRACPACCRSSCTATTSARRRPCRASRATTRDWLSACKGGTPASGNFDYASRLTEFTLLGCVALRVRKQLKWDAPNMKATNAPQADQYLKEAYRAGWELPV